MQGFLGAVGFPESESTEAFVRQATQGNRPRDLAYHVVGQPVRVGVVALLSSRMLPWRETRVHSESERRLGRAVFLEHGSDSMR